MSLEADGLTRRTAFREIPIIEDHVFEVRPGLPMNYAITEAICLAESIKCIANETVGNGDGMEVEKAYLVRCAAESIEALLMSVDGACPEKEAQA